MHEQTDYFSLISEHTPEYERKQGLVACWCKARGMDGLGHYLNPNDTTEVREGHPCCKSCTDWATFYIDLEKREKAARHVA